MEDQGHITGKEQYVETKYDREHLMVSRTKAYDIVKEIDEEYTPEAVVRIGRSLRVSKDVLFLWVEDHVSGARKSTPTSLPVARTRSGSYSWRGEVGPSTECMLIKVVSPFYRQTKGPQHLGPRLVDQPDQITDPQARESLESSAGISWGGSGLEK